MSLPIKLISTDFDGTLHSDFGAPPVAHDVERLIAHLQSKGAAWVINTGRDLDNLMEGLARAQMGIRPDYVVVVEREIYQRRGSSFLGVEDWNQACSEAHSTLFSRLRPNLPEIFDWIRSRYKATLYEDNYSPFCLIAESTTDAEEIHEYLTMYSQSWPELAVVRNDIYARFSHKAYNKGTALAEIGRRLNISPAETFAAGDHLNDMPMLSTEYARWLAAPDNAITLVKDLVRKQNGYVSHQPYGYGVARGLEHALSLNGYEFGLSNPERASH
jgi:HAD superfamily hydrolase (TIGR01484 family)